MSDDRENKVKRLKKKKKLKLVCANWSICTYHVEYGTCSICYSKRFSFTYQISALFISHTDTDNSGRISTLTQNENFTLYSKVYIFDD